MENQYPSVADLRLAELACASDVLGIHRVFKFGYKDSGMMGSESTHDEGCLWYQWQHNPETVIRRVVEVIREVRPQVIVTFNRYGGYGHPDHIAIQRATTEAFSLASDPSYVTQGLQPYTPLKLYYASTPGKLLKAYLWWMTLRGHDVRRMGVNKDLDYQAVVDNMEPIHTVINVGDYFSIWDKAADCHVSQGRGRGSGTRGYIANLPLWLRRRVAGKYGLTRVHPTPKSDRVDEYDIFDGIKISV